MEDDETSHILGGSGESGRGEVSGAYGTLMSDSLQGTGITERIGEVSSL